MTVRVMLKIKVKIFFPLIETLQLTKTNMAIWISIDFLFAVFTFMKKFQQNLLSHVRLFRLSAVLIKQLVEYLLKQARSIWLQGNCRGPYRLLKLPLVPKQKLTKKDSFPPKLNMMVWASDSSMNYQDLYNTEYVECPGERHFPSQTHQLFLPPDI